MSIIAVKADDGCFSILLRIVELAVEDGLSLIGIVPGFSILLRIVELAGHC